MKILPAVIATIILQLSVIGIAHWDTQPVRVSESQTITTKEEFVEVLKKETETVGNIIVESAPEDSSPVEEAFEEKVDVSIPELPESAITFSTNDFFKQVSLTASLKDEATLLLDEVTDNNFIEYEVKSGDTLSSIWKATCGGTDGMYEIVEAMKDAGVSHKQIKAGEVLKLKLSADKTVEELTKDLKEGKKLVLTRNEASYDHEIIHPVIEEKKITASGTIFHSLFESASRNEVSADVVDHLVDLFGGRIEFSRDLQPGDRFSVVYHERHCEDGTRLSAGPIQSASIVTGGKLLAVIRYEDAKGNVRYYDENGEPIGNYFLRYPVKFTRISSVFTKNRFHPVLKRSRPHNGVDFAAPTGTPVRSVADGVVVKAGYSRGGGNTVKIKHTGRYSTAYLHLSRITSGIKPGTRVKRGEVIGKVGSTGLATGPHLHYSLYDHGKYVDPMKAELPKMPEDQKPIPNKLLQARIDVLRAHHEELQLASMPEEAPNSLRS